MECVVGEVWVENVHVVLQKSKHTTDEAEKAHEGGEGKTHVETSAMFINKVY